MRFLVVGAWFHGKKKSEMLTSFKKQNIAGLG